MPTDSTKKSQPRRIFHQANRVIQENHDILKSGGKLKKYRGAVDGTEGEDFALRLSIIQEQFEILEKFSDTREQRTQLKQAAKGWVWDEAFPKAYFKHLKAYDDSPTTAEHADDTDALDMARADPMHDLTEMRKDDVAKLHTNGFGFVEEFGKLKRELAALQEAHKLVAVDLNKAAEQIASSNNANIELQEFKTELSTHIADLSTEVGLLRTISMKASQIAESTRTYDQAVSMMAQMQQDNATSQALRVENAELKAAAVTKRVETGKAVTGLKSAMETLKKELEALEHVQREQDDGGMTSFEGIAFVKPSELPKSGKRKRDLTDDGERR